MWASIWVPSLPDPDTSSKVVHRTVGFGRVGKGKGLGTRAVRLAFVFQLSWLMGFLCPLVAKLLNYMARPQGVQQGRRLPPLGRDGVSKHST